MKKLTETLAANVRRERKKKRMNMRDLSAKSGLGLATICEVESGRANPTITTLESLSYGLKIPAGDLLD